MENERIMSAMELSPQPEHDRHGTWLSRGVVASARGIALLGPAIAALIISVVVVAALTLIGIGVGLFLLPAATMAFRWCVNVDRRLAHDWDGVAIAEPYLPEPETGGGLHGWWQRCQWVVTDPATWRDLAWGLVNSVLGVLLAIAPAALIVYGMFGMLMPFLWEPIDNVGGNTWYMMVHVTNGTRALVPVGLGVLAVAAGLAVAPRMVRLHAVLARTLLAPTAAAEVQRLTRTRTDAVNTQARELQRIERDLHDGAQARLVAMGMNLGVAENLIDKDPDMARTILSEARTSSASALTDLRNLVRGIHPPVLADRGLVDAVRALAMDCPLDVDVTSDLPGQLELPVESAVYFAISEALTNVTKHAGATHVTIDLSHNAGLLTVRVVDNGNGGADIGNGTGLQGLERRLATFDGVLGVTSPHGGPTTITMELPCALSSPKTSSS